MRNEPETNAAREPEAASRPRRALRLRLRQAAIALLALILGFGCVRAMRDAGKPADGLAEAAPREAPAPSPLADGGQAAPLAAFENEAALFAARIDPPGEKLFSVVLIAPPERLEAALSPEAAAPSPPARIASAAPESKTAAATPEPAGPPRKALIVGDSLAVGVGLTLAESLKRSGGQLEQRAKTSSGLNSPRFHDWNKELARLLTEVKPDLLVVMLGANDANNGSGSEDWTRDFADKAAGFLRIAAATGVPVRWIGLPPMRDPAYSHKVKAANQAMRQACAGYERCAFIDAWPLFADQKGEYVREKSVGGRKTALRAKDGVHFTMTGYKVISDAVLDDLSGSKEISLKN